MRRFHPLIFAAATVAIATCAPQEAFAQSFTGPATITQPTTAGDCVKIDSQNHLIDALAPCGTGTAPSPANPTATIGATAVNGTATTYMRSDGAPALPVAGAAAIGGVFSKAAVSHNFLTSISSANGAIGQAQPACADISDAGTGCSGTLGNYLPLAGGTMTGTETFKPATAINVASYDMTNLDAAATLFNLTAATFPYVSPSVYNDTVYNFGINVAPNGTQIDGAKVAAFDTWENKYSLNNVGPFVIERHFQVRGTDGVNHRPITFVAPIDGVSAAGSIFTLDNNVYNWNNYNGTQYASLDTSALTFDLYRNVQQIFHYNNIAIGKQQNAANSGVVDLPFIDNLNNTFSDNPIYINANTAPTGLGVANAALTVSAASAAANDAAIFAKISAVTGSSYMLQGQGSATTNLINSLTNTNGSSGGVLEQLISTKNTGTEILSLKNTGSSNNFSIGMDGSGILHLTPNADSVSSTTGLQVGTDGTVTVTNASAQGLILGGTGIGLDNNKRLYIKDGVGTYQSVVLVDGSSQTQLRGAGGGILFEDQSANSLASLGEGASAVFNIRNRVASTGVTLLKVQEGAGQSTSSSFSIVASNGSTNRFSVNSSAVTADVPVQINASNPLTMGKSTDPGTAPGAAFCKEYWVAGTNANTGKKVAYCGTSTTPVTIVDNVGGGL